jgi:hypothetical protein
VGATVGVRVGVGGLGLRVLVFVGVALGRAVLVGVMVGVSVGFGVSEGNRRANFVGSTGPKATRVGLLVT